VLMTNWQGTRCTEHVVISPLLYPACDLTKAAKAPKIDPNTAPLGDFASAEKLLRGFFIALATARLPSLQAHPFQTDSGPDEINPEMPGDVVSDAWANWTLD